MAPLAKAPKTIEAEFVFPYLAHAPMEPLNCTVDFDGQAATLWMGSQMPGLDGMAAAAALGLKPGGTVRDAVTLLAEAIEKDRHA